MSQTNIVIAPPRIRTSSNCKLFNFKKVKFWAERGLVHIVEEETGEYTPCSRAEWMARIINLNDSIKRMKYRDERTAHFHLIDDMIAVAKEAKHQGDPFDPRVGRDMMSRGPTSVSMVGTKAFDKLGKPQEPIKSIILPEKYRGIDFPRKP